MQIYDTIYLQEYDTNAPLSSNLVSRPYYPEERDLYKIFINPPFLFPTAPPSLGESSSLSHLIMIK